ncbi:MAG TPA: hypothetical protein VKD22_03405 [Ramlibacter sp.]|nr:hypothetical protein [Ramlibacter sp.]
MTQEQTELKQEEAWTRTYYDASGLTWRVDGRKQHIDGPAYHMIEQVPERKHELVRIYHVNGLAYHIVEREGLGRIYHVNGVACHIDDHQVLVRKHHIEDPAHHIIEDEVLEGNYHIEGPAYHIEGPAYHNLERHIPFFHEAPKEK